LAHPERQDVNRLA